MSNVSIPVDWSKAKPKAISITQLRDGVLFSFWAATVVAEELGQPIHIGTAGKIIEFPDHDAAVECAKQFIDKAKAEAATCSQRVHC